MNLEDVKFQTPCSVPWEEMKETESDVFRHCGKCDRNVYNVSLMKRNEAEDFISRTEGRECIQLWKRSDGTVVTADCPQPIKPPPKPPAPMGGAPLPPPTR